MKGSFQVGTWTFMPVNFSFGSGMTLSTALEAPMGAEMISWAALWPSHHSFLEEPTTFFWVAAMASTGVLSLSIKPKLSWMTMARRAKELVVQEALLTIL